MADPWRMEFVEVGGLRLRVGHHGAGEPLLLLTGIGANIEMWGPLAGRLPDRQLIAVDVPGTGRSSTPRRPLRMPGYARIVERVLDGRGCPSVDVLGYSWGGALAQQLAHQAPARVRRLVLRATAPGIGGLPGDPRILVRLLSPRRYYSAAELERTARAAYGGRSGRDPGVLQEHQRARFASPPSLAGYHLQVLAISGWTSLPWLHTIRAPTLVLAGDDDPLIPVFNSRLLCWLIPDCRVHIVRGGGHLFMIDQTVDAIGPLQEFLATGRAA